MKELKYGVLDPSVMHVEEGCGHREKEDFKT